MNTTIETPTATTVEYREVQFIPAEWMERAAWTPGLRVYSRTIQVPVVDHPLRRRADHDATGQVERDFYEVERLIRSVLAEYIKE